MDSGPGGRSAPPRRPAALTPPLPWELVLSGSMAAILAVSFALVPEELPSVPLCQFRALTGRPCPGCGLTRAFCAISHGRFLEAWRHNPFGFVLYSLTAFFLVFPAVNRLRPGVGRALLRWRTHQWLPAGLLATIWAWGFLRLIGC